MNSLNTYCIPDPILSSGYIAVNENNNNKTLWPHAAYILVVAGEVGETTEEQNK